MISPTTLSQNIRMALQGQWNNLFAGLNQDRRSFWVHWSRLAENFLPRRYKWFVNPNQWNRGSQINTLIVDETGVIAARTCAAGMLSGLTDPTRQWFRMGLHNLDPIPPGPIKDWLSEVERRMLRVFSESNFYQSLGVLYHDLVVFNTASMLIYEDPDQVIRCYNPALGEFFLGLDNRNTVDIFTREYPLTIKAIVDQFGIDNVPADVATAYKQGGTYLTNERILRHVIQPNVPIYNIDQGPLPWVVPPKFKYREAYWLRDGANGSTMLGYAGYNEKCFVGARWATTSNDAYGSAGPGMDALGASAQLQIEQRRKAEAIDKLVRPPMVGSVSLKNEPASILPSAITYVADINSTGFKPAFQVDPRIAEMSADIEQVQQRIKEIFFVDLFMMISNLQTVRTATEIDARREEKLIQLGPVVERFLNEVLDPVIDRTFAIMQRRGLLPEPPPGLSGEINVQYISMLAQAATATQTSAIERLLQVAGSLVGVQPDIMDNIDTDKTIEEYADLIKVDPRLLRTPEAVAEIRDKRQQEKAATAAMQATAGLASVGETLSNTNVGGGRNALEAMTGGVQ